MTNEQRVSSPSASLTLADMAYELLKTSARPMPTPAVANRIRVTHGVTGLTERGLMDAVAADPRIKRYGSGHLMLEEWDGRGF